MNLLPRPRHCELSDRSAPYRIASQAIDGALGAQAYRIAIGPSGASIRAGDASGLFYARATLGQIAKQSGGELRCGAIYDHPDIPVRGVMLDVSRDKVPTMDSLKKLVARLASWKINHLQLYTEHSFAYRDHETVHANASPFTHEEIQELDGFCRRLHVELAPNQNCLGHMNRWLKLPPYRHLALQSDTFTNPFGMRHSPMALDPRNPAAFDLVANLLGELVPLFASRRVHIGLDEVWELPAERISDYVDWISRLQDLDVLNDKEVLVWGDVLTEHPELLSSLGSRVTVCEWGYEGDHPFAARARALGGAGVKFWVCPGTSSWLSIVGRVTNAKANCLHAARAAIDHGAEGYLIADWGDQGHLQQQLISEPGFAYGAAVSWCAEANQDLDLGEALSTHAFDDPTGEFARILLMLGDAYINITPQYPNMSALVRHLYYPQLSIGRGVTSELKARDVTVVQALLADARAGLARARPGRPDGSDLVHELTWSIDLLALLADDAHARLRGDGSLLSVPQAEREVFAEVIDELIVRHRRLWLARNRPGGLEDSVSWLENLSVAYRSGRPHPEWAGVSARSEEETAL